MSYDNVLKFSIGQIIYHKLFDYRGVIIDVDPVYKGTDEWYVIVARRRPPKDKPWYHVLVDKTSKRTYVAERNLETDKSGEPIKHPDISEFFSDCIGGVYIPKGIN
jgi:heat shock protein HspQ